MNQDDLSEQLIDEIAEKAAQKALDKVYIEVGKSVLKRAAWITGVLMIALLTYLAGKGSFIDL